MLAGSIAGVAAVGAAYFSPILYQATQFWRLKQRTAEKRLLALTYDDGPSSTVTPSVLDALAAHDVRATFFMLGRNAERSPEIADRVARAGHDVGCHSDKHLNAWKVSPWRAVSDIDAGYGKLARWVRPTGMFRPPHGKVTLPTYWTLRRRRAQIVWWTLDSGDTHRVLPEPEQVVSRVVADGGGVVLMHDLARSSERDAFVIRTTELLLKCAEKEGLRVSTMSAIMAKEVRHAA
jgi:peptidoglycan/xylan/chitin deacetylase (PgdA/CDA1 family)